MTSVDGGAERPTRHVISDESALAGVRRSLRHDLAGAGADSAAQFDCLVAVTEACTNALVHGLGDAAPEITWRIEGDTARFLVEDYSRGAWDSPLAAPANPPARSGGFGLFLMENLMDQVRISIDDRGTRVELAKRIC